MKRWRVSPSNKPLSGQVRVLGDKSISHRAILFAGLAKGFSTVTGLSSGEDNRCTLNALCKLGVEADVTAEQAVIKGVGLRGLRAAADPNLDCGNSGTTMRLLAGLLSAFPFESVLFGDASLTRRPMRRVIDPLTERGAVLNGVAGAKPHEQYPPLRVGPLPRGRQLGGINYALPVSSAQVKTALILSGLYANGTTQLSEPMLSRDHSERMLRGLGVTLVSKGTEVTLEPLHHDGWPGFEFHVPGDFSSAAFFLAAACMVPDSEIELLDVGINPTRTGFWDALKAMSATIQEHPASRLSPLEPSASLVANYTVLSGMKFEGETVTRMIDEVPMLLGLAAVSKGITEVRDAGELRVKESDRLQVMGDVLTAFGVNIEMHADGMTVEGKQQLKAARVTSHGDHRIAMASAMMALRADGESVIEDVSCVATSFPGFAAILRHLGAEIQEENG